MFRGEIKIEDVKAALSNGKAEKIKEEIEYIRFKKPYKKIERGTVITKERIIWGYPHIPRIFNLDKGILRNIKTDIFYVEEKIDGYNLRIAQIEGKLYAFTRGGYVDPFATEKVRGFKEIKKFLQDYPDFVLCCEMIGNTPFTEPTDNFDVRLFIFDIDDGKRYLPPLQKYDLIRKYGLDSVPFLGRFSKSDIRLLKKQAYYLNKSAKEGMVIKSADRLQVVKFVTPAADIQDIEKGAYTFFDLPDGFFMQRLLRSAFFIKDFELNQEEYASLIGNAFEKGLQKALKTVCRGGEIEEEYRILVQDPKIFNTVLSHIGKDIGVKLLSTKKDGDVFEIRFVKLYKKTTKMLRDFIEGKGQID
ncbi:MAG: RNA ligase [Candidatus Bilamarchaeaceae archaeon]